MSHLYSRVLKNPRRLHALTPLRVMGSLTGDGRRIAFWLICIFALLGVILLAIALYDPTSSADRTAMGCFGIAFTGLAILLLAVLIYDG